MNKIDAFFGAASLLLVWVFAIFLLPGIVMMFVYSALAAWWVGTTVGGLYRKWTRGDFVLNLTEQLLILTEKQNQSLFELSKLSHKQQFIIDSLMFEYCPDEMTPEQIANFEAHVQAVNQKQEEEINIALLH